MRFSLLFFLLIGSCFGQLQSAVFTSGQSGVISYTNLLSANVRFEFGMDSITLSPAGDRDLCNDGVNSCKIASGTTTLAYTYSTDADTGGATTAELSGHIGLRIAVWRDKTTSTHTITVCDFDGTNCKIFRKVVIIGADVTQSANFIITTPTMHLAYWRRYTAVGNIWAPAADTPFNNADSMDFRFDGTCTSTVGGYIMSSNCGTFANTTLVVPVAIVNPWGSALVARTGDYLQLSGSSSFSQLGNPTYLWSKRTTGNCGTTYLGVDPVGTVPAGGTFSSAAAADPTFLATNEGTYAMNLVVTDANGSNTNTITSCGKVGFVATDSNGVVTGIPTNQKRIIGPTIIWNGDPTQTDPANISYYNLGVFAWIHDTLTWALANTTPSLGTTLGGGMVTASPAEGTLTYTGTSAWTSAVSVNDYIIGVWDTVDGIGTGRSFCAIASIDSTTKVTCYQNSYFTAPISMTLYKVVGTYTATPPYCTGAGCYYTQWSSFNGSANWNYYDTCLAARRLFYRTQIDTFHTIAQQCEDTWNQWGIDHGYGFGADRAKALVSQFARARELYDVGGVNRFVGLQIAADRLVTSLYFDPTNPKLETDFREAAVIMMEQAIGALSDPDPTRHTSYCTHIRNTSTGSTNTAGNWILGQAANGTWAENLFAQNSGFPAKQIVGNAANAPWRAMYINRALQFAYDTLMDTNATTGCNDTTLAASLLITIKKSVNWSYDQGRITPYGNATSDGGIWYEVNYESNAFLATAGAGTCNINATDNAITCASASFGTNPLCDGTKYIGLSATQDRPGGKVAVIERLMSCTDATHGILENINPTGNGNIVGSGWYFMPKSSTATHSSATYANSITDGGGSDLELVRTVIGQNGHAYEKTGIARYSSNGLDWWTVFAAGPRDGPGGILTCNGTGCYTAPQSWMYSLRRCAANSIPISAGYNPPCDSVGTIEGTLYGYYGKNFAEGAGIPDPDYWLAARLSGAITAPRGSTNSRSGRR